MNPTETTEIWANKIIDYWNSKGIDLEEGASLIQIDKVEKSLDLIFPDSFKKLYLKANGFKDNDWNENMFSIWPLERVVEENKNSTNPDFIGFCDYLINSHQIGFLKDKEGVFKNCDELEYLAETFEEAITLINGNSDKIYI